MGRYYAEIDATEFRVPKAEGLAEWFEAQLEGERGDDYLWLVAEHAQALVGYIQAQLWQPWAEADRAIMREASEPTLKIDAVMVSEVARRQGVGTALMEAQRRGGGNGVLRRPLSSSAHGPTSVPFDENRMGYTRKTIGFAKRL